MKNKSSVENILQQIISLPDDLHGCGSVPSSVLRGIYKYCKDLQITNSIETGSGKTSLLFSHLSEHHKVFAVNDGNSVSVVKDSPLLNKISYELIEGPTQITLPKYQFTEPIQLAYLDGPHGYPFPDLEYFYVYPQIQKGGLLIIDDILIPSIHHLYKFLKADEMYEELELIGTTAFFRRTNAETFNPYADGWWLQGYNKKNYPIPINLKIVLKSLLPKAIKKTLKSKIAQRKTPIAK